MTRDFQRLLTLLAARCSQVLNMSALSRQLGVSITSIRNWISILEASRIIYLLQPYYNNLGKRITKNPKIYFTDCGIVACLTGLVTERHIMNGPLAGPLFENYCISEILKHNFNKGKRDSVYYLVMLLLELDFLPV